MGYCFCGASTESINHILFRCMMFARSFWTTIKVKLNLNGKPANFLQLWTSWRTRNKAKLPKKVGFRLHATVCWKIWRERNSRVFLNKKPFCVLGAAKGASIFLAVAGIGLCQLPCTASGVMEQDAFALFEHYSLVLHCVGWFPVLLLFDVIESPTTLFCFSLQSALDQLLRGAFEWVNVLKAFLCSITLLNREGFFVLCHSVEQRFVNDFILNKMGVVLLPTSCSHQKKKKLPI